MLFSLNFARNVTALNGNNCCKTYNFRIKGRNVHTSIWSVEFKTLSNKHGQENKKKLKNKKYYAIRAVPNPTGNLRNI